jgi:hypothetical protein
MKYPVFLCIFLSTLFVSNLAQSKPKGMNNKKICVEVVIQEHSSNTKEAKSKQEEKPIPKDEIQPDFLPKSEAKRELELIKKVRNKMIKQAAKQNRTTTNPLLPLGQTPENYLKRLIEHFVTHQEGFEAVSQGCSETIKVELYPLAEGWTVFTRYSANGREERIDKLFPTELSQFAERAVNALLRNVPISATIKRDTVLKADSLKSYQRIKGTNHFVLGLGTQIRGGRFATTLGVDDGGVTEESIRVFSPMTLSTGYRGKFENWGIEAITSLGIGTSSTAPRKNSQGGHIDFGGDFSVSLHFLRYFNPRGLTSFYLGSGSTFELLWFSAIKHQDQRSGDSRSTLLSGGLDVDLVFGWEFMRASSVQFFLQGELNVPAYVIDNEDDHGSIHSWFPGLSLKLGMVF